MKKSGIDYFPLDVDLDTKFQLIEAEFGLKGFAVIVKLFQRIYGEQGYYCEWNDEVALLFGRNTGLGDSVVSEIVTASIRREIFDKALYDQYGILTSRGIQKRYWEAVSRRTSVEFKEEYLLFCDIKKKENVNILSENVNRNQKNVCSFRQRKGKESKEEESKAAPPLSEEKRPYGEFQNVLLTAEEHKKLEERFGEGSARSRIENLSSYMAAHGKKYRSHYATILNWSKRDEGKKAETEPRSSGGYREL